MSELVTIKRVTVVADTVLEKTLLAEFLKLGARGYTCVYVFGKGQHEPIEDPFTGRSRIRIEVVVRPEVANAIIQFIRSPEFSEYALIGYIDEVQATSQEPWY